MRPLLSGGALLPLRPILAGRAVSARGSAFAVDTGISGGAWLAVPAWLPCRARNRDRHLGPVGEILDRPRRIGGRRSLPHGLELRSELAHVGRQPAHSVAAEIGLRGDRVGLRRGLVCALLRAVDLQESQADRAAEKQQ
ncbi:hypothetical protein OG883_26040 [Streptomyces sp. NBC_01142]|uniref:hypothetical protein n=1 Tax=Streptomyces sp. NBC_01142 TaxID=2975865 RepID=UPI0022509735|nr:hypothetical protein [Streptomyces sp. NBC_01142]MCX4823285.1 hypothetical protein [Streptomyces sp. NBC_01142]